MVALVVLLGGALAWWWGTHNSPAVSQARRLALDHRRALALARVPGRVGAPRVVLAPPRCGAPRCVQIPALGVDAPVLPEAPAGSQLRIPPDVHDVGWDEQTPVPGRPGVTLLAGHVNWVGQGLGALGGIGQLVPGDLVRLDWDGQVTTWVVSARPELSPNSEVHPELFSVTGPPRLALVTCGGPFSETPAGGSYADNVIVWATPAVAGTS
jgi:hypothetical protein